VENFNGIEKNLHELLKYLDAKQEHPAIQSAIIHMQLLVRPPDLTPEWEDNGLFARMAAYLFLAKYGYDIRGYMYPERVWLAVPATYFHLQEEYRKSGNLTMWLEYIAESLVNNLTAIARDIETSASHIEYPPSFWDINDRQKEILTSLDNPGMKVTNRMVQKKYRLSQITASRDLTKLSSLGLLYPHGKGRSVYYTKI
jgi:Fic family protein